MTGVRKIPATVEFEMDATFTNITKIVATVDQTYQFMDSTVRVEDLVTNETKTFGTNGPVVTLAPTLTGPFPEFNKSFPMGGFGKTSFTTTLDIAQ